ncbi:MAG: 5-bromo-4-chloroindolyl phosphate hydrolysis family protein [Oscillospiraceae bacterium]
MRPSPRKRSSRSLSRIPRQSRKKKSSPSPRRVTRSSTRFEAGGAVGFQNSGAQRRDPRFQALRADQADRNSDGEDLFAYVKEHPQDMGQIRQFLNYYLPTTIKLLEQYVVLQNQGMRMGNIDEGMKKIEDMLDKVIVAFQRQLDGLSLEGAAVDITADIQVMEQMMASEGLTGKDF